MLRRVVGPARGAHPEQTLAFARSLLAPRAHVDAIHEGGGVHLPRLHHDREQVGPPGSRSSRTPLSRLVIVYTRLPVMPGTLLSPRRNPWGHG